MKYYVVKHVVSTEPDINGLWGFLGTMAAVGAVVWLFWFLWWCLRHVIACFLKWQCKKRGEVLSTDWIYDTAGDRAGECILWLVIVLIVCLGAASCMFHHTALVRVG